MNEAVGAAIHESRLHKWLCYDPARIEAVEATYDQFCAESGIGLAFFLGIIAALVCGLSVSLTHLGEPVASYAPALAIMTMAPFYGIPLMAVMRVDRSVLRTILRGVVNPVRACIFAAALACLIVPFQSAVVYVLFALHASTRTDRFNPLAAGIMFGMAVLVVVAPLAEEFLVQGWVQTKARGLGPRGAGLLATIVFLILHVPSTLVELTRVFGLGAIAWLRGTTRSLAACITLHATANLFFGFMILQQAQQSAHQAGAHL